MKKFYCFFLIFVFFISAASATHIIGGEMRYEYIGTGASPNSKQYRIRLSLFKGNDAVGAPLASQYIVGVFNKDDGSKIPGNTPPFNNWLISEDFTGTLGVPINISPCIQNPPTNLNYTYKNYSFVIELNDNNQGYTVAFQTYSRQLSNNINVNQGANYLCEIPGRNTLPTTLTDNSPQFKIPVSVICANSNFALDFGAADPDTGDSLVYTLCNAFNGGAANNASYNNPAPPPYSSVNYILPYAGIAPLGPLAIINSSTGIISGTAPDAGRYVICVCISVYRGGAFLATHRKDLIVEISGCIPTEAIAMPSFTTCDGFNIQFDHSSTGANTVFWDFGDSGTLADSSTLDNPTYVYSDTGVYTVKFIINKGGNCTDSTTRQIGVYPGFYPGFRAAAPFCAGVPVQFTDTSRTAYGVINSWRWDFGNTATFADTSRVRNPEYSFPAAGTFNTRFIVSNSKGCTDTVYKDVMILSSPVITSITADSAYCGLDSLQLSASGTGNFTWTPGTRIIGANTATPTVFPTVPTTYIATLENQGCRSTDSVRVSPVLDLTNNIVALPTTICEGDTLSLTGSSNKTNNLRWAWGPPTTLTTPASQSTLAFPGVTTTYTLQTRWGNNCVATRTINIPVKPLAIPNAGPDTAFCNGQAAIQLSASGGNSYSWTPATGLSSTNIFNPIASPTSSTDYIVAVGVTGCVKTKNDTVRVTVRQKPILNVTNDTLICIIDTLRITSSAGPGTVLWGPNYMISDLTSPSPTVSPDVPTLYKIRYTDFLGCFRDDSVFVDVKAKVTLDAGNDTSICRTEGFILNATGDALSYSWSPGASLSDTSIRNPFASPTQTTIYTMIGNIGKCEERSQVTVTVAPFPMAFAGLDTSICVGLNVQLSASGGSSYNWSPTKFLSNPLIPNPVASPPAGLISYIVTVTDTLGCPKPVKDTVQVRVIAELNVNAGPADTSIVEDELLFLQATGALNYTWSPATWLSDPNIANPVANPGDSIIRYAVLGRDATGCLGSDTITVRVFRMDPDMYVPTAFTPNGDGNNDVTRPVLLGMKTLNYFRVYNRFGELMFSTTQVNKGWDGMHKGKPQDTSTFVWMAQGVTYKGEVKQKKGYVVLIR